MKRPISAALTIAISLTFFGCAGGAGSDVSTQSDQTTSIETTQVQIAEPTNKVLRVLAIGNSYSEDATKYLYDIAEKHGYETIMIGQLYIGGCSLKKHWENASQDQYAYKFYTNFNGEWEVLESCSMKYAIQSQPWDVITLQQASVYSGDPDSYEPYLTNLIDYVQQNKTNPDARLAWHMTWAYQRDYDSTSFDKYGRNQTAMYQAITEAVQTRVLSHEEIEFIIPSGTAVQNARSSYMGDTLSRDGTHMSDFGRVLTAYTWLAAIEGRPLSSVNITKVQTKLLLNDQEKSLIMESVNNALSEHFAVTQSKITK